MNLPSGTLTFLFTDVEGSTRLWQEHPAAMRPALARHDALLRQAIEDNNGFVFKTSGDSFCAAFTTAPEAINAALAAQCALHAEPWPEAVSLRVRMALHTGAAELRDGDYFGQPLNRVARLLSAGHGGQTLLSNVTHDLIRDLLPPSASLKSLGAHRLRNLERPEPISQLLYPGLPAEFPPLNSLEHVAVLNNLPQQITSFIGREKEIEAVRLFMSQSRLLTLTGSGGCGKTRLSLQAAAGALENYSDGAWFVELAPLAAPSLVPQTVAQTFNVSEEPGRPLLQTLVDFLKPRRLLLILDNCEHLLDACARFADAVLKNCPYVLMLVSSREALGIAGEQTYRVPSLSLPDARQKQTVQSIGQYEAARLFVERALAIQPAFSVTDASVSALAQLCIRLDGIPLALELAAARTRSLSVAEVNDRLDNRFRLLTGGSRTALPRQQTLRALIDWSFDLLNAQEQALLCRLSVFAGGWTLQAAEAVGTGTEVEEWETLDLLTSLVDKSLVVADQSENQTRYRLLETVRHYALERLEARGKSAMALRQHQAFFVAFAETAEPHLKGPEGTLWLNRLEMDHDNLRAAMAADNSETALRLMGALYPFWEVRGYFTEGRKRLMDALADAAAQTRPLIRAKALSSAGTLARLQGDYLAARSLLEESLALWRELGDKSGIAHALSSTGNLTYVQGDYAQARALYEESLALRQELEDESGLAQSFSNLGNIAYFQGDYARTSALYEQGLALCRKLGNKAGIAHSLSNLGLVVYEQGDYTGALPLLEESLALCQELGSKSGIAYALSNMGNLACYQGEYAQARALYEQSLALYQEMEDKGGIADSLLNLGNVAHVQGNYAKALSLLEAGLVLCHVLGNKGGIAESLEAFAALAYMQRQLPRAARLWGAAEVLRETLGTPLQPCDRPRYDQQVAQARSSTGEDVFTADWTQGRTLTMEQAIEYAMKNVDA